MDAKKIRKAASVGLLVVTGGVLGFFGGKLGAEAALDLPGWMVAVLAAFYIPAFFIIIALHEAGHALAGILVDFNFRMYVVGPFLWEKEGHHWRFKWNKNLNVAGGMVICVPTGAENLRKRFMIYAGGGPLASLVTAGFFWLMYWLLDSINESQVNTAQMAAYLLLNLSILSAAIFVVTIIPVHTGGFSSDGARMIRLARGGDVGRFELLLIKIISSSTSGIRPSLLNAAELEEATALANKLDAPFGVYLHGFNYQAAWDRGEIDRAEAELQRYINRADSIPTGIQGMVWLDAAMFYGLAKHDPSQAAFYFEKFKPAAMIPKSQIFGAEAVLHALQNEPDKAHQQITKALEELPSMMDKGMAIALGERLHALQKQLSTNASFVEVVA